MFVVYLHQSDIFQTKKHKKSHATFHFYDRDGYMQKKHDRRVFLGHSSTRGFFYKNAIKLHTRQSRMHFCSVCRVEKVDMLYYPCKKIVTCYIFFTQVLGGLVVTCKMKKVVRFSKLRPPFKLQTRKTTEKKVSISFYISQAYYIHKQSKCTLFCSK